MERRKFMKSLGLAMPAAAFPIGGMFAQTVPRYRPVKITKVSSTAYSMPIPASGYSSSERAGTKKEWGRALRVTPTAPTASWNTSS